jgi:hypothetical protein
MSTIALKHSIMNGTIASAVSDNGATSTTGAPHDPFEDTTTLLTKVFILLTGGTATATKPSKLLLTARASANMVNIVPTLDQTVLSGSKFANAGYTAVYNKTEENFYNVSTIYITEKAVLMVNTAHAQDSGTSLFAQSSSMKHRTHSS